jgi:hypothetical protein
MSTTLSKSLAILLGIVFFATGVSFSGAATVDTIGGQGSLLNPTATPTFGGQGSIVDPTAAARGTSGGTTAASVNISGSQLVNPDPATTAVMSGAITANTQAQAAVTSAQTAYTAAVASGNSTQIATAQANLQAAQASLASVSGVATTIPTADEENLKGVHCGFSINPASKLNLIDCVPTVVYYLVYKPTSYLLMGAGYIFDKTITLSIDRNFVDQQFVADSWKIIRDFSNMLFIFILLYTGIMTMFGSKDWKRTVIQVVIVALLINFSLFFTKVVIDAGNILATGVYSSINTGTSFSASLAGKFQPQVFLDTAGKVDPVNATIVFIIAAIVSVFAAWVFFKAALLFVGRLLAFWFLMIVSPFAFISTAFPKGNIFSKWFGHLTSQAFVAPVFLFLLYIIMQVLSAGGGILNSLGGSSGSTWFDKLIAPILIAVLIILALQESLKFAEGMAGDFGKLGARIGGAVMGIAGGVAGVAGGAALGGAALAGRKVVGGAAQRLADKGAFQGMAAGDSKFGRFVGRMGVLGTEKARTGTFDARGVGLVQKGIKQTGINMGAVGAGAKGGYAGMAKRQETADLKRAELFTVSEGEKSAFKSKYDVAAKEKEAAQQTEKAGEHAVRVTKAGEAITAAKKNEEMAAARFSKEGTVEAEKDLAEAKKAIKFAEEANVGAEKDLAEAKETAKKAAQELAEAKAAAEKDIDNLQKQRSEAQAQYVESGTGKLISHAGAGAFGLGATYSHSQAQKTAAKIRAGKSKEEKEKEKTMKALLKSLKETQEKEEGGEKEGKPAEAAH